MNSSIFTHDRTSRSAANRVYNQTTIQSQEYREDLLDIPMEKKVNLSAVKNLKPSKRQSTYGNSFTNG